MGLIWGEPVVGLPFRYLLMRSGYQIARSRRGKPLPTQGSARGGQPHRGPAARHRPAGIHQREPGGVNVMNAAVFSI